jgi:hypothetical protein
LLWKLGCCDNAQKSPGKLVVLVLPVIPALKRLRQEDSKFEASLGYIARPCLKNKEISWALATVQILTPWAGLG